MLLVIVEGLGAFADPEHQQLLADRFAAATLHNVTAGTAPFFGSTTAGEMRELCVSRESYELLLEEPQPCLPGLLRHAGYDTIGIHGYPDYIFEREDWWPNAGFNRMLFAADLYPGIESLCGGTFRGICDREIGARLIDLVGGDRGPRFIYWLTLNTHVPIRPGDGTPRLHCEDGGPFDNDEVCYMTELWIDVLDAVTAIAGDERLRPLDVLVVGDHAPPLWSRSGRALFRPGEVSWFRLAPKGRVEAGPQEPPRRSARRLLPPGLISDPADPVRTCRRLSGAAPRTGP